MKKLGLLVIHGIGTGSPDYDAGFKKLLFQRLRKNGKDPDEIAYAKIFWSKYINERQARYYAAVTMNPSNRLDWDWARWFVLGNLADAASYQWMPGRANVNYRTILRLIFGAVRELRAGLGSDDKPLIVCAHSLGCFVISNYIWDAHKLYAGLPAGWPQDLKPEGKFEHMVNIAGIMTFGCNIPLFVIGQDPIEAIRFPHDDLAEEFRARAEWHNYYDPDDVLGWPLRELRYSYAGAIPQPGQKTYADVVTADHAVQVGTLSFKWWGWTPFSHLYYWTDRKIIQPLAEQVGEFL